MNANFEELAAKHGEREAENRIREIAAIGGFGNIPHDYVGGLDIQGVLDPTNTAISEGDKDKIAELAGVSRKEADRRVESGEVTSTESFKSSTPKFPKAR